MNMTFSAADEAFRRDAASWLADNLSGEFAILKHRGGPGDEHSLISERRAWEKKLAAAGWNCLGWAAEHGGRDASISQQVIFAEEYARAGGPGRLGHIGEGLAGPTIAAFASPAQQARYLPGIRSTNELWCQGYSEPGAGSDLAAVKTRAVLGDDGQWRISGQKVWTSLAHLADWCFVLARTDPNSHDHKGLGFFLVSMHQAAVTVRPIEQLTGSAEFNEVFFDEALAADLVGQPGEGWKIAMALLGFERGVSTLGQQMQFRSELDEIIRIAKENGAAQDPDIRSRIAEAHMGLSVMRYNALRMLSDNAGADEQKAALVYKLHWSSWHRHLGKLAMDVLGTASELCEAAPYALTRLQALFLFSRADTIYGGSNQIQRNLIAERALGMPKEAKGR
ncbi:acyl-CoA dehydrogenase family protein [Craterilacuibacter sp. RT1T]|uniref:acyl-CoA dehydrogenase family protein n=1 Tax=Craterilacuibacter sp. RT1T TaxID=2942211 RepID=UPI0020BEB74E|nr:acyl-CoA dehydrogenase family protein [Craterilacuibacter sp. RT1T]MCL6262973.1 acyl-CoA dehydrogenase family protein [Craterilacuibacter sp. RT1T]